MLMLMALLACDDHFTGGGGHHSSDGGGDGVRLGSGMWKLSRISLHRRCLKRF